MDDLDDLDGLIADSVGGVQSALDVEKKAAQQPAAPAVPQEWARDAVRDLKDSSKSSGAEDGSPEALLGNLMKAFQDENFQKVMQDALQESAPAGEQLGLPKAAEEKPRAAVADAAPASAAAGSSGPAAASSTAASPKGAQQGCALPPSSSTAAGADEFLQNFMKGMEGAAGQGGDFEKSLSTLMTTMLSKDLICEPMQQIVEKFDPWLKSQKNLSQSDRSRYEKQLKLYKQIVKMYTDLPDPLPDAAREEVQRLLAELNALGQPPEEVTRQVAPAEAGAAGAAGEGESFDDFMKQMGLENGMGSDEQEMLQKLTENPEELAKAMQEMAEGLPEEACKQQ